MNHNHNHHHHHHHHHSHQDGQDLAQRNESHHDEVAAKMFDIPWVAQLCKQVSDELRNNFDWIGVQEKPSGRTMLDYACGNGMASRALGLFFTTILGVDISSKMVEQYNLMAEKEGFDARKMHAIQGNLLNPETDLSSEAEYNNFDLVVMSMALHHVGDHTTMIQKLSDRLSPGGVLVIVDLVDESESGASSMVDAQRQSGNTMSHKGFTEEEVRLAYEKAGLEGWAWKWCAERSRLLEDGSVEAQGFLARGQKPMV